MVKKKKEIKIVRESDANYTFLDPGIKNHVKERNVDTVNNTAMGTEKEVIKARSMGSKKSKIQHKNRIVGGQNKQGHSSVYE